MFKNVAIALLIATVSAYDADFVDEALNTGSIDNFGEVKNTMLGQGEAPSSTPAAPATSFASSSAGASFVTPKYHGSTALEPAKVGYKVPNFGQDFDMKATAKHIRDSEKKLKHKWNPKKLPKSYPKNFAVPNFGIDKDILDATASIKSTEKKLKYQWRPKQDKNGYWEVPQPIDASAYSYRA